MTTSIVTQLAHGLTPCGVAGRGGHLNFQPRILDARGGNLAAGNLSPAAKLPPKTCDCGNPGVKQDGSGWFCLECEQMVDRVTEMIADLIEEQRGQQLFEFHDNRREYERGYRSKNRKKLKVYHRNYERKISQLGGNHKISKRQWNQQNSEAGKSVDRKRAGEAFAKAA